MGNKPEARFAFIQERAAFADEATWIFERAWVGTHSTQLPCEGTG
jgi:hypothetical protein